MIDPVYTVLVHRSHPPRVAFHPLESPAPLILAGWSRLADTLDYRSALDHGHRFEQLPPVERWWAASWAARAVDA